MLVILAPSVTVLLGGGNFEECGRFSMIVNQFK
jgi:hypothetical protein